MIFGEETLLQTIGKLYVVNQFQVNTIEEAEKLLDAKEGELGAMTHRVNQLEEQGQDAVRIITEQAGKLEKAKKRKGGRTR